MAAYGAAKCRLFEYMTDGEVAFLPHGAYHCRWQPLRAT
jgi:hypothetical protein